MNRETPHTGKTLSDKEVEDFIKSLDANSDGYVSYQELEQKLDDVARSIDPQPQKHHLHHSDRKAEARHTFLRAVLTTDDDRIPNDKFAAKVKTWDIPSLEKEKKGEEEGKDYLRHLPWTRKWRAWWSVEGPQTCFLALVVAMQLAFGIWQLVKYATTREYQAAFGWGVAMAKTCAGALYPTMFFLVLSMSRWFATAARQSYYVSRFINWDRSQSFHIKMSIVALCLATLHMIGHLTGTFVFGSRASRQDAVANVLGPDAVPRPYSAFVSSLPGWTGLTAIICFYLISAMSMPQIRKWSYEVFQLGHLLMFPMIALLMAHGTAGLLQWPMLGYFLAFPTLLVVIERVRRVLLGLFVRVPAHLQVLDDDTVEITITIPTHQPFHYEAGQYIFLQIPQISVFQWHPFTISTCYGREVQVHIKTDGDWTGALNEFGKDGKELKHVGVDGPFGAPAQRFYEFDNTIIVGAGIGVTPFSGILSHMQHAEDDEWRNVRKAGSRRQSLAETAFPRSHRRSTSRAPSEKTDTDEKGITRRRYDPVKYRRCDFHWIVKDKNYLLWFSELLNEISTSHFFWPSFYQHLQHGNPMSTFDPDGADQRQQLYTHNGDEDHDPNLDIRITTHVTKKRTDIAQHIYRHLLEAHRTPSHPKSPLTGLVNPTHFGRPDLAAILNEHYEDMLRLCAERKTMAEPLAGEDAERKKRRIGVFFCGAPVIGEELASRCQELTLRGRSDGSGLEYWFMMEVFG